MKIFTFVAELMKMIETLIEYENGGRIDVYQITPRFDETIGNLEYEMVYASLRGTPFWGRCPDFCVDGVWYEHEGYDVNKDLSNPQKRADTFSLMIKHGVKQADRLIVEDCGVGRSYAKRTIYNRVHFENQCITEVYIRTPFGLEHLY